LIQDLAIYRARLAADHDRDVWRAWFGERFARVDKLGLPNEFLIAKIATHAARAQSVGDMKRALNQISAAVNGRGG